MKQNDILESCFEAIANGATVASCIQLHPTLDDEARTLLYAASRLRTTGQSIAPTASFKRRTRSRLMQRMAADQVMDPPTWQQRLSRFRAGLSLKQMQPLAAALAVILVITLGAGAVSAAAKNANPDSKLYPIKRLGEHLQTLAHPDDIALQVQLAQTRLDEANDLLAQGKIDRALAPLEDHQQLLSAVLKHLEKETASPEDIDAALSHQLSEIHQLEKVTSGATNAHLLTSERLIKEALAKVSPRPEETPGTQPQTPADATTPLPTMPEPETRHTTPGPEAVTPTMPVTPVEDATHPASSPTMAPPPSSMPISTPSSPTTAPSAPSPVRHPPASPSAPQTPSWP